MLPNVLIVDDSGIHRRIIAYQLGSGFEVAFAGSARETYQAVANERPDVVLLDYNLPDVRGLELLTWLVESGIPTVVITGVGCEQLAVQAIKLGACDYLTKSSLRKVDLGQIVRNTLANLTQVSDVNVAPLPSRSNSTPSNNNGAKQDERLFLGRFKLLDTLGAGRMGTVYLAEMRAGKKVKNVALKVMSPGYATDPKATRRFAREAKALLSLHHPNIVTAIEANFDHLPYYLVMDYVEGRDLNAWIKEFCQLPISWACECIRQAACGLQYAHTQSLVHRDIKPSNLLVVTDEHGGSPQVKVLDFGLARFRENENLSEMTKSGAMVGTVDYIAPEQTRSAKRVDPRADIYALGCTLYKMLVGDVPFHGDTIVDRLMARHFEPPPRVSSFRDDIPPELDAVVARMMAREPDSRYKSAAAVALALYSFARTPTPARRKLYVPRPAQVSVLSGETSSHSIGESSESCRSGDIPTIDDRNSQTTES